MPLLFLGMQVSAIECRSRQGSAATRCTVQLPCQLRWPDGLLVNRVGTCSDWAAQRAVRRAVLLGRTWCAAPGDPPPGCTLCRVVHLWTNAAGQAGGILLSSAALGLAGGSAATDGPASEASGGTCRLCRPTASRSAARDRSEAEGPQDRCCQVPLCPFPLLPPFRHSTAGALAEAWNIRGNVPYTLDPYTPSPSAQRVYGSCRFRWIYWLLGVQPFCRPLQRRTDASSAPPRGTSGYPYGSSHVASAMSGAARSAPLVHPAAAGASDAARSSPPLPATCRVRLWKPLQ